MFIHLQRTDINKMKRQGCVDSIKLARLLHLEYVQSPYLAARAVILRMFSIQIHRIIHKYISINHKIFLFNQIHWFLQNLKQNSTKL